MYSWRKPKAAILRTNPIGRDTLEELEMAIKDLEKRGFTVVRRWQKDQLWKDFTHTNQGEEKFRRQKYEETLHRTRYYVIMEKENEEVSV